MRNSKYNWGKMKKPIIIFILILLVGCTPVKPVTQNFPNWTQTQNQRYAYTYQENLAGATQDQILDRFGAPDEKSTRQDLLGEEQEIWVYGSSLGYNRKIRVTFVNGVAEAINYNWPYITTSPFS